VAAEGRQHRWAEEDEKALLRAVMESPHLHEMPRLSC
jgi:hypothetical protein